MHDPPKDTVEELDAGGKDVIDETGDAGQPEVLDAGDDAKDGSGSEVDR